MHSAFFQLIVYSLGVLDTEERLLVESDQLNHPLAKAWRRAVRKHGRIAIRQVGEYDPVVGEVANDSPRDDARRRNPLRADAAKATTRRGRPRRCFGKTAFARSRASAFSSPVEDDKTRILGLIIEFRL